VEAMSDIWMMAPTRTDRSHFLVVRENGPSVEELAKLLDSSGFEAIEEPSITNAAHLKREDYVISLISTDDTEMETKAIGVIVPGSKIRKRFLRMTILALVLMVFWIMVAGAIFVGQGVGMFLAIVGFNALLAAFSPFFPALYQLLFLSSALVLVTILYTNVWYALRNRSIVARAQAVLVGTIARVNPSVTFEISELNLGLLEMKISDRIPDDVRPILESGNLGIWSMKTIDDLSCALVLPA
jgi:hypothetical protein